MATDDFLAAIKNDPAAVASFATRPGLALIGGGLPLYADGQVLGGIGVVGAMTAAQDRRIAEVAAAAASCVVLAICRVAAGIDASSLFAVPPAGRARRIAASHRGWPAAGGLRPRRTWSRADPGGCRIDQAQQLAAQLPLGAAQLIDVELIALTPLSLQPPAIAPTSATTTSQ